MRIAVLQLCRLGDIIQTLPMLASLKRDGYEVELVIRQGFHELPIAAEAADAVHVLPREEEDGETVSGIVRRMETLARFCRPLKAKAFDVTINLSHDRESGWLALYLDAKSSLGVSEGRDRNVNARDAWTQYLLSVPSNRQVGAFNLADVYGRLASTAPCESGPFLRPSDEDVDAARALLGVPPLSGKRVGLVPGASDGRKQWPTKSYAALASALAFRGHQVFILGAPDERALGEEVRAQASGDVIDLVGKTSLPVLAATLQELELVVTNDTGTMHLAAALRTRTLSISVGPSAVFDSAPYASGHITVVPEIHCYPCDYASFCADTVCHDQVTPDAISTLAGRLLEGRGVSGDPTNSARIFRTRFHPSGLLSVDPIRRYPMRAEDAMRAIYRRMWTRTLSACGPADDDDGGSVARELLAMWDAHASPLELERLQALASVLKTVASDTNAACAELLELTELGSGASVPRLIDSVSESLTLVGRLHPLLRPLMSFAGLQLQLAGSREKRQVVTDLLQALSSVSNRASLVEHLLTITLGSLRGLSSNPRTA